jgi:hypothetical protein
MKNRFRLIAAVILLLPCTLRAQWSVGLLGGAGYNVHSQDLHYLTDYRIQGAPGLPFGLTGQYDLTDWFGRIRRVVALLQSAGRRIQLLLRKNL